MSTGKSNKNQFTHRNRIKLVKGGSDYFTLLEQLIDNARISIYIRIYIFDDDATGSSIAEALVRAAKRKVAVYIVADGYASQRLSMKFIKYLRESGIHFRYFEPFYKSSHFYFGRRMHEKVFVSDKYYALVGGMNFADRYNDIENVLPWLDYALYIEGEAALELDRICATAWDSRKDEKALSSKTQKTLNSAWNEQYCSVRIRRNDWVKGKHEIWKTYFNFFNQANNSISIICSYFLPGSVLRKRLSHAVRRGVKVKVILAGPSDIMLAKYAERYLYNWMLQNNIEIYEYQPTVLHSKLAVVDDRWVTIGSYNVNNISAYASLELNLDVRNRPFAKTVQTEIDKVISNDCIRITKENFATNATLLKRFLQKTAYEFIRVALNLSTFYFKHK